MKSNAFLDASFEMFSTGPWPWIVMSKDPPDDTHLSHPVYIKSHSHGSLHPKLASASHGSRYLLQYLMWWFLLEILVAATWDVLKTIPWSHSGMESHEYHEPNQLTGEGLLQVVSINALSWWRVLLDFGDFQSLLSSPVSTVSTHHLKVFGLLASLL